MTTTRDKIEQLIRDALSDTTLSEEAMERVDEIHRSAVSAADQIAGGYDQWTLAYEEALHKELVKRQREVQRLRERGEGKDGSLFFL